MVLWNSRRRGKPRDQSRVSAYFDTPRYKVGNKRNDLSSLHGYTTHDTGRLVTRDSSGTCAVFVDDEVREFYSPRDELHIGDVSRVAETYSEPLPVTDFVGTGAENGRSNQYGSGTMVDGLWSWIPHLSQSADDFTVSHNVRDIFVFAELFVNNFYTDRRDCDNNLGATIDRINHSRLLSTSQFQERLAKSRYQTPLIKHMLISLLLDLISFDFIAEQGSLLPQEFQHYTELARARTRDDSLPADIPHLQPALSSYRLLTAYIHPNVQCDPVYLERRQRLADKLIEEFCSAFNHWSRNDIQSENRAAAFHLLLEKTAGLGVFLFAQPAVFYFDWEMTPEDHAAGLIPVNPRLLRVFDSNAQLKLVADHMVPMKCARVFDDV